VVLADHAKRSRLDRLAVLLHGGKELCDNIVPKTFITINQLGKVCPTQPGRFQDGLLLRGASETTKLLDQLPNRPVSAPVPVVGDVGCDQPLEMLGGVPV